MVRSLEELFHQAQVEVSPSGFLVPDDELPTHTLPLFVNLHDVAIDHHGNWSRSPDKRYTMETKPIPTTGVMSSIHRGQDHRLNIPVVCKKLKNPFRPGKIPPELEELRELRSPDVSTFIAKHWEFWQKLKFFAPDVATYLLAVEQLWREAQLTASFGSREIVTVYNFIFDPETFECTIVLEDLTGRSLVTIESMQDVGEINAMNGRELLQLLRLVAKVMKRIRQAGVDHRDLKPGNVFFKKATESEEAQAVGIDFGAAVQVLKKLVGTRGFMSFDSRHAIPEDEFSDTFSMALWLHSLLGQSPNTPDSSATDDFDIYKVEENAYQIRRYIYIIKKLQKLGVDTANFEKLMNAGLLQKQEIAAGFEQIREFITADDFLDRFEAMLPPDPNTGTSESAPLLSPESERSLHK